MLQRLPSYKCHKEVMAVKLSRVELHSEGQIYLVPEDKKFDKILVSKDWFEKHKPDGSGYFVWYKDGYMSWSPTEAFEEGYTLIEE